MFTPAMRVEICFCKPHTNYLAILSREARCEKLSFFFFKQQPNCPPLPMRRIEQPFSEEKVQEVIETMCEGEKFSWLSQFVFSTTNMLTYLQTGRETQSSRHNFMGDMREG